MCSSFSSSSSSCPSPTELCTSQVTNCTVNYSDIQPKILFSESQKVTVRAEYTFGEVSSEHYEFESMKICKCHEAKNVGIMLLIWTYSTYMPSWMFQHACISSGQITKPKIDNLTALSDHLLVKWHILTYLRSSNYPCQVRYRKVCSYSWIFEHI